jgi:glucose/arabinose dehydrogenase
MNRRIASRAIAILPFFLVLAAACSDSAEDEQIPFGLATETVTSAPRVSEMVWLPDGRALYAEQLTGRIMVIRADGTVQEEPWALIDTVEYIGLDWGLTGLAVDPDFENNGYVYALYMAPISREQQPAGPIGQPTVARLTDEGGVGTQLTVITDDFPQTPPEHPGYNGAGKLHFGPDGFLYLSIGDYDTPEAAQDLSSPVGKLLRIDRETGEAAAGNPFEGDATADPRVFAYGFREPFDFAFHPDTGAIYGTDNTTVSCEELNIIDAGGNYGWPEVGEFPYADCSAGEGTLPIHNFAREGMDPGDFISLVEVTGLAFVPADAYPTVGESLFVCESWQSPDQEGNRQSGLLRRLVLAEPEFASVTSSDAIVRDCRGDVSVSPDGVVYYATETEVRRLTGGQATGEAPPPLEAP